MTTVPSPASTRLPLWAGFVDVVVVGLSGLWLWVLVTGGHRLSILGVRVSIRSHWRIAVAVIALLALRHALAARPPFMVWLIHCVRRWPSTRPFVVWLTGNVRRWPATPFRLPPVSDPARWWQGAWGSLVLICAAWVVMTWPQATGMNRLVKDPGDPLMKIWQLSWVAHQLPLDPIHLYDANIFYPESGTLANSDAMIGPAIVAAPFLWLGVPDTLVFNLLLAAGFILSGVAMFGLVRCVTGYWPAAMFAGLAFAFLPYRFNHYSHLELQFTWGIPFALWALHRLCETGRLRDGMLVGLALGLQAACSMYYAAYLGVFIVGVGFVLWRGSPHRSKVARALAAGALVAGLCALPLVMPHVTNRATVGERGIIDVRVYSATLASYLAPHDSNRLYAASLGRFGVHENRLFPGFLLVALALVGMWPIRSVPRLAYVVGTVLAFDASLGANGFVYPFLFNFVAPFRGFRVPSRFGLLTATALVVLAAFGVARIRTWVDGRLTGVVLAVVLTTGLLFEYRSFPLALFEIPQDSPPVYRWLAQQPTTAIAELPVTDAADFWFMYRSRLHWQHLMNGQSGFFPPWYNDFQRSAAEFPDALSVAFFRSQGVRHIIVHANRFRHRDRKPFERRLKASHDLVRQVAIFPEDGVRVFELR